ncbi:PD-(D/E)XK nuclease family protein [Puniceicoccales bacterium CK1056]|uniref:PD-(D/E)XK nuclease family protein n=1 Tax=Oceanipulchritudo coccoides TaxID=2706888 RepID=A0A6B2LYD2_9BACT|nr:PD-(D/E)XK nuclease family protein [Oceanipulchritudo coccoides]NDV61096.1 PD-(D/E)XK nuclease family protein [Oceanipulchritudo coccoides]
MITATLQPPVPAYRTEIAIEHLSPSSLKTYLTCPRQFYFTRIEKLPYPVSPALHLGKAVHAGIEVVNRKLFRDEPVEKDNILQAYRYHFGELEEAEGPVKWKEEGQRDKLLNHGEHILETYLESSVFAEAGKPLAVEVRLSQEIQGTGLELLGFLDRVNRDGTPVDYKTAASSPDIENEVWQHQLQLTAYSELIVTATGQACPGSELVFLIKTKTPKIIRVRVPAPDKVQRQRFWSLINVVVEGIRSERFHPIPSMACGWCPFRTECSRWCG